ncbi:hypothetical protein THRCLA_07271 [Thraustotheca clavata]|uniref:Uncharacterized protein n=1 Tax=Thraustotheca clavata TaxID=74557 RepID=A0A1V9ZF21_9STRA|nr:hypothetical protein THRCLA_07271 [Thraustotheca clavata]
MALARFGHLMGEQSDEWNYYILIGDPTIMILTNPLVLIAFSLDALTSFTSNMLAVIRASQNENFVALFCSILYLSRGVCLSSLLVSGGISFCSGNIELVFELFRAAQTAMVPHNLRSQCHENFLPTFFYVVVSALLPLCYGFLLPLVWHRRQTKVTPVPLIDSDYSSIWFNPIKTRAIIAFERCFTTYPDCESTGGMIYALFADELRYRRFPTISFRGADCFTLCYQNGTLKRRIRLSLLSTLDRNLDEPALAIFDGDNYSAGSYNELVRTTSKGIVGRYEIHRSKLMSAWCT